MIAIIIGITTRTPGTTAAKTISIATEFEHGTGAWESSISSGRHHESHKREGPANGAFQHTSALRRRRSSGCGREQLPVLGQSDRVDGVHDAIRRNDIGLGDPSLVDSHVR
jgi:hypothetical protein